MYDLPYYKDKNDSVIVKFMEEHPFAFLSGCDSENKPVATQVPVFIEQENDKQILRGHIMRNTDHHKAFLYNPNVLVVFTGANTYVSGSWYSNPNTASTWNYMSVQAKGIIKFGDDIALADILRKTSLHFENYDTKSPTVFDNLSDEFLQKFMNAVVAFKIEVVELNHVFKLSQDRDTKSYENIKKKLTEKGGNAKVIADEMEKRTKELFPGNKE